jgi:hypothetical protein
MQRNVPEEGAKEVARVVSRLQRAKLGPVSAELGHSRHAILE